MPATPGGASGFISLSFSLSLSRSLSLALSFSLSLCTVNQHLFCAVLLLSSAVVSTE